jgi:hypothetical protein
LNIIGKGSTWADAPLNEPSCGITQVYLRRPTDLVIDMNVYDDGRWGDKERNEADLTRKLCEINNVPYIDLKNYPLKEIMEIFDTDYFSSTVDYAIAYALFKGHREINLYGITMSIADYSNLKCGCDFWCGVAKGMGVKIRVHGRSTVMKTVDGLVYGYGTPQGEKE